MSADFQPYALENPITDGARLTTFFNGRLLTAQDLSRDQATERHLRARLGQAIGDGVVSGLRVRMPSFPAAPNPDQPVVRITAGAAVNRLGTAVRLDRDIHLSLARPSGMTAAQAEAAAAVSGCFGACSGLPGGSPLVDGGAYLLTIAPSSTPVGRAPASGLGSTRVPCGTDASAEAVVFRILRVPVPATLVTDPKARNRLAHLFFGTEDDTAQRIELDPFGLAPGPHGLLDRLRTTTLVDDEVALACVLWIPGQGVRFIDEWCVRRPIIPPAPDTSWPDLTGARRAIEGRARFLQFQAELAGLAQGPAPSAIRSNQVFHRLPPAGLVPLSTSRFPRGFTLAQFFGAMITRPSLSGDDPLFMDGAKLHRAIERSYQAPSIDPDSPEFVWLYLVRENAQRSTQAQPIVLFTSGQLPYLATARFDQSHFDLSNYALSSSLIEEESP